MESRKVGLIHADDAIQIFEKKGNPQKYLI